MHLSYAVIDLSKLRRNFFNIRKKIKNVKIMAVVKADAYGHGIKETAAFLSSLGNKKPEYFAVAFPDEAVELREAKIKEPILVFEPFIKDQAEDLFRYNLIATVFDDEHIRILRNALKKYGKRVSRIKVHVKVNTGMNRLGINHTEAFNFIKRLSMDKDFEIDGIYTHFANSEDKDKSFAMLQIKRFNALLKKLDENKIKTGIRHAANSGAVLDLPESYYDMVRPGILMYGQYPSPTASGGSLSARFSARRADQAGIRKGINSDETSHKGINNSNRSIKLEPVMSVVSRVSSRFVIDKGETVSYGRKFTAKRRTTIISVPIGYADGFSRGLSNRSQAIINGKKYNQIGSVTMDRIMFEIKNDNVKVGDKVIILGKDKGEEITVWDWCKVLHTIPYEVMCGFRKRISRVYRGG